MMVAGPAPGIRCVAGSVTMVQAAQPQGRQAAERAMPPRRATQNEDGLTDELREQLRAMIAWRAPALKELEKH